MSRALLFLQHFPGGAAPGRATGGGAACGIPGGVVPGRATGGGAACGIPGGVVPGRATGWWCGLWDTRRRCAWTGYSLVVRPVGWVARARHLCRPREGLPWSDAKKARTFVRALISNMAVRGGLTRFARPCGAVRLLRSRSVQLAAPVVEPRSGVLIPPNGEYKRKKPVLSYELSSRIWR